MDKISLYTTCFNAIINEFDLKNAIDNYLTVADEVVIGTIGEPLMKDNTLSLLTELSSNNENINLVISDINPYEDPLWDGKLKDAALKGCSHDYCIQCDLDERVWGAKNKWHDDMVDYIHTYNVKSVMLPVINLYKHVDYYKDYGFKWYFHVKDGCNRGPVNFAKRDDKSIDVTKSDGTELITNDGNIVSYISLSTYLQNDYRLLLYFKGNNPGIIHYGYLNLARKVALNKSFWKNAWSRLNGSIVNNVATDINDMENYAPKWHGINI